MTSLKSVCFSQHGGVFFKDLLNSEEQNTLAFFPSKQLVSGLPKAFQSQESQVFVSKIEFEQRSLKHTNPKQCTIMGKIPKNHHTFWIKFDPPRIEDLMTFVENTHITHDKIMFFWVEIPRNLFVTAFDQIGAWYPK